MMKKRSSVDLSNVARELAALLVESGETRAPFIFRDVPGLGEGEFVRVEVQRNRTSRVEINESDNLSYAGAVE